MTGSTKLGARSRPGWRYTAISVLSISLGFGVRSLLPPFVIDDVLWREMLVGPPLAGVFAVVAATIAFFPAFRSTRITRENAAREQWWKRAEWALGQAGSDSRTGREVANDALVALSEEATRMEFRMIFRTIENLQSSAGLDAVAGPRDNGWWRRYVPWVKSAKGGAR
ncbi:hypothetical protein N1028_18705 [Herbiconiux sp. CPCC 203407]|uniref:Uncharacterized protein n=1 Tax=Herbiconiux oxytropis TaxID=2970915 RepID=A0AA41XJE8_9MICO|nr:hypothetical protein [Herbiconiux oxytropis]MCS5723420.1 hypothetical protein [Herbiconiux oxytropis]MCS5727933.1 hypothetical protein [Herbiconiux oxytropis]